MERDLILHSNFPCMNFNFFFIKVTLSALKKKMQVVALIIREKKIIRNGDEAEIKIYSIILRFPRDRKSVV